MVSKNPGGTKRVTSLADALKLNFGLVTTERRRGTNMTGSMIMNHLDGLDQRSEFKDTAQSGSRPDKPAPSHDRARTPVRSTRVVTDSQGSPIRSSDLSTSATNLADPVQADQPATRRKSAVHLDSDYDDRRAQEVIHGRLIQGHIVEDDFPSPGRSTAGNSVQGDDPMTMSHASSFFAPDRQSLAGGANGESSSDEEDNAFEDPRAEHMITLVGDVRNRTVFIVDDMIDKPGSWIAAAETVVKKGLAKKVYCIATHGVFGGDCLEQLQACECIDTIVVTNSFPINEERVRNSSKLVILDLSFLLSEAIRRNHYGESISPLFQHIGD